MMIRTFGLKPKEAWEEYCVFDPQKKGVVTATDVFGAMALTADAKVNDNTLGSSIGGGRQQYSNSGWMTIMMMMMMMTPAPSPPQPQHPPLLLLLLMVLL